MISNKAGPLSFFILNGHMSSLILKTNWGLIVFESSLTPFSPTLIVFESESLKKSQGHSGASCSNTGRIQTKENIVVGTFLIGAMPKPLGAT